VPLSWQPKATAMVLVHSCPSSLTDRLACRGIPAPSANEGIASCLSRAYPIYHDMK
jgi:hypothetical protein